MAAYVWMLYYACLSAILMYTHGQPIQLYVKENQPSGTSLGFVTRGAEFLDTLQLSQKTDLRYKLLTQGNTYADYFWVNEGTGELKTASELDREDLCSDQTVDCSLDIDVAIHSDTFLRLIRAQITVTDVNDNAPVFPEAKVTINFPESSDVGFTVPIQGATDRDAGPSHGIKSYQILPSGGQFSVRVVENLDGTPELEIVLDRKLDREITPSHTIVIVAKDGGDPPKTGEVKVHINVLDANDHSPIFTHSVHNVSIAENLPINALVTRVQASDQDTGVNSKIVYRFSPRTLAKFPNVFSINGVSGEIKINSSIDYEIRQEYRLVVEAVDQGSPKLTSQALVTVSVKDINDNSPIINFNFLSGSNKAELSEYSTANDFVAHISVTDLDTGPNSDVDCRSENELFKIERLYDNEFQVLLNTIFDRELVAEINVTVTCTDNGQPSLSQSKEFTLVVLDENDHDPIFLLPKYTVTVREDFHVGDVLIKVKAEDSDQSENAEIQYLIEGEFKDYFMIDSGTGHIKLYLPLDFENSSRFDINVIAKDGGFPSRNSTAAIQVHLIDVNDELPYFNKTSYSFQLQENSPRGTLVGSVQAFDPDLTFGGKVVYSTEDAGETVFEIHQDGKIYANAPVDRETSEHMTITVMAADVNDITQISKVKVKVDILDANDNQPLITFPNDVNNTVVIPEDAEDPKIPIATVLASDADLGENQTLVFEIKNKEMEQLFYVDRENGSIYFKNKAPGGEGQQYNLDIVVKDSGVPQLQSTSRLQIIVLTNPDTPQSPALSSNTLTVIIVVCITVIISVIITVWIYFVKRNTTGTKTPANSTEGQSRKYDGTREAAIINNLAKAKLEETENKTNMMLIDETLQEKNKALSISPKLITDNPADVFDLSQHGHAGIWLNYLRKTEHNIPRTSSTNSGYTSKSFSQMSLDTLTSDSGRGTSEMDSQENIHRRGGPISSTPHLDSTVNDGDYMDMQRSRLSSISTGQLSSGHNSPRQTYSQSLMMSSFKNPTATGESLFRGDNSRMQSRKFYPSLKSSIEAKKPQVAYRPVPQAPVIITKDSYQHNKFYNRQQSVSDTDDSATTTSGSYTVDMGEVTHVEFDASSGITLEFNI